MAEEYDEQIENLNRLLEQEYAVWTEQNIPPPENIFLLGNNQFMTHVHIRAMDRILRDLVDPQLVELAIKEQYLEVMRETRQVVKEERKDELRRNIVDGINVIKPRPEI